MRLRSTTSYRSPENIGIVPIVESESELREVERKIFLAHIVIGADDSALEQRPERFDVVCVNDAANVLALSVANRLVRESLPAIQILVARVLIGSDEFNFAADSLRDKAMERRHIGVLDHLEDHIAF